MPRETLLVLTNCPDAAVAERIARLAIENSLAACANILAPCRSVYRWQGQIEDACEAPLLLKTTAERYAGLQQLIAAEHPYDVPEIVALPVVAGLPAYLDWVAGECAEPTA